MLAGAASCQALALPAGRGSPQKSEYRSEGKAPGVSIFILRMKATVDGTENQTDRSCSRMKR